MLLFQRIAFLVLVFAEFGAWAQPAPSSLAEATLEKLVDESEAAGREIARLKACGLDMREQQIAVKAQRDFDSAMRRNSAVPLRAGLDRGWRTPPLHVDDERLCLVAAMFAGRKAQLLGVNAAKKKMDASLIPETMGSVGSSQMGIAVYAQTSVVDVIARCIPDNQLREKFSKSYVEIMDAFVDDFDFKATPDWLAYPYERSGGRFPTRIGLDGWVEKGMCPTMIFRAGMATEVFAQLIKTEDDVVGHWLRKRLRGR